MGVGCGEGDYAQVVLSDIDVCNYCQTWFRAIAGPCRCATWQVGSKWVVLCCNTDTLSCLTICLCVCLSGGDEDFAQAVGGAALASGGMVSLKSSSTPGSSSKHDAAGSDGSRLYKKDGNKQKSKQQGGGSSKKHRKQ